MDKVIYKEYANLVSEVIDLLLKAFSLISFTGLISGGVLIWRYLAISGISGEIIPALSSPQTLIALAVWAAILSALTIMMMFVAPVLFRQMMSGDRRWNKIRKCKIMLLHSIIFFAPPAIFLLLADRKFSECILLWSYIATVFSETLIVFFFYTNQKSVREALSAPNLSLLLLLFLSLAFTAVSTLFVILIIAPTLINLYGDGRTSLYAAYLFFALYAPCMAASVSFVRRRAHLPMILLSLATTAACLMTDAPKNAAKKINIGNFTTSITVDEKGYAALSMIEGLDIKKTSNQTYFVKNVYVLLDLPSKLILAASSNSKEKISISTNYVIARAQLRE